MSRRDLLHLLCVSKPAADIEGLHFELVVVMHFTTATLLLVLGRSGPAVDLPGSECTSLWHD